MQARTTKKTYLARIRCRSGAFSFQALAHTVEANDDDGEAETALMSTLQAHVTRQCQGATVTRVEGSSSSSSTTTTTTTTTLQCPLLISSCPLRISCPLRCASEKVKSSTRVKNIQCEIVCYEIVIEVMYVILVCVRVRKENMSGIQKEKCLKQLSRLSVPCPMVLPWFCVNL